MAVSRLNPSLADSLADADERPDPPRKWKDLQKPAPKISGENRRRFLSEPGTPIGYHGSGGMDMGAITRLSFEEFQKLPEQAGVRYELDEGELVMEPSPTFLHNRIRDRIARRLSDFVEHNHLGEITVEMDFRLGSSTVRKPDIALVSVEHLRRIDVNCSPVDGAPILAIEVISRSNPAEDIARKVQQYLRSGSSSVWLIYPRLKRVEIHSAAGVKAFEVPEVLRDEAVLPGFSLTLEEIL